MTFPRSDCKVPWFSHIRTVIETITTIYSESPSVTPERPLQPFCGPWKPLLSVSTDVPFPNGSRQVTLEGFLCLSDDAEYMYLKKSKACIPSFTLRHTMGEGEANTVLPGE